MVWPSRSLLVAASQDFALLVEIQPFNNEECSTSDSAVSEPIPLHSTTQCTLNLHNNDIATSIKSLPSINGDSPNESYFYQIDITALLPTLTTEPTEFFTASFDHFRHLYHLLFFPTV